MGSVDHDTLHSLLSPAGRSDRKSKGTIMVRDALGRTVAVHAMSVGDRVLLHGSSELPSGIYSVSMLARCGGCTASYRPLMATGAIAEVLAW